MATKKRRERIAVDRSAMARDKAKSDARSGGSDLMDIKEGQTLLYLLGPVHESWPKVYVEAGAHFQFGPNNTTILNLEGLDDVEPMLDALEKRKLEWDDVERGWEFALDQTDGRGGRSELRPRWYFAVVPFAFRRSSKNDFEDIDVKKIEILGCGKQIYDGIMEAMFEESDDITDPDAAILLRLTRKGQARNTEYKVAIDTTSARKPIQLDDETWEVIEEGAVPGGNGDVFRALAGMAKTESKVRAEWRGEDDDEDEDDDDDRSVRTRKAKSSRRRKSDDDDPPAKRKRSRKPEPEDEPDEDEDEEEEDEEEEDEEEEDAPPPRKRRSRKKPDPVAEDEPDEDEPDEDEPDEDEPDEDEPDEDEDEEDAPPPRKRRSRKVAKEEPEGDDEDEEEEDTDADELEAKLRERAKRRKSRGR